MDAELTKQLEEFVLGHKELADALARLFGISLASLLSELEKRGYGSSLNDACSAAEKEAVPADDADKHWARDAAFEYLETAGTRKPRKPAKRKKTK
jgi:hypothetical protein